MENKNASSPNNSEQSSASAASLSGGLNELPTLRIVPVEKIFLHEFHDNQRTPPLIESITSTGIITNPPIVTPTQDGSGCYMVLDGANRISAFRAINLEHAVVQVMEPDSPGLKLRSWNHVIWGMAPETLQESIHGIPGFEITYSEDHIVALEKVWNRSLFFYLQTPDKRVCAVKTNETEMLKRLHLLHQVTNAYKERASLDRTALVNIDSILGLYKDLTGLLVFPHFSVQDVMAVCRAGELMPAGITRSVISPRALRVNYPVEELRLEISLEEKNERFTEWLRQRLAKRGVRYYQEPTMIYDE